MYDELNAVLEALATIQVQLTGLAEQVKALEVAPAEEPEPELVTTLEDCVAAAKAALAAGEQAQVKAALDAAGADRVSHLKDFQMAAFLLALQGDE